MTSRARLMLPALSLFQDHALPLAQRQGRRGLLREVINRRPTSVTIVSICDPDDRRGRIGQTHHFFFRGQARAVNVQFGKRYRSAE